MCTTQIMSSLDQATNMLKNYMKSRSIIYHSELCTKIKFSSCFLPDFANVCTVLVWRPVLLTLNFLVIPTLDLRRSFLFDFQNSFILPRSVVTFCTVASLKSALCALPIPSRLAWHWSLRPFEQKHCFPYAKYASLKMHIDTKNVKVSCTL